MIGMAPWEELRYFKIPVETNLTGLVLGSRLVKADPMRVILVLSVGSGTTGVVSTSPSPASGQGLTCSAQTPTILTAVTAPALVQAAWYNGSATVTGMTTIEVFMLRWPDEPSNGAFDTPANLSRAAALGRMRGQQSRIERMADLVRRINEGRT